jgi:hypothetical protein
LSDPLAIELPAEFVEAIAHRAAELVLEARRNPSPWMTRPEAAAYTRLPESRLEKDRGFPCHREGRRVLYHRDELDAYLSSKLDTTGDPV